MRPITGLFAVSACTLILNCAPEVLPERSGGLFWLTPQGLVAAGAASGGAGVSVPTNTAEPRVFVTSLLYNGNPGGIAGADAKCMADINRPTAGTYKALLADDVNRRACSTANCSGGIAENIDWVLRPDQIYFQANGAAPILITTAAGIHDFGGANLGNPFITPAFIYWTGLQGDWRTSTSTCLSWGDGTDSPSGRVGVGLVVSSNAVSDDADDCDTFNALLCVEQ